MAEYIEREALVERLEASPIFSNFATGRIFIREGVVDIINKHPTADVKEAKYGEWMLFDNCANAGVYCSVCNKKVYKENYANQKIKSKFCPNCGAKMDGDIQLNDINHLDDKGEKVQHKDHFKPVEFDHFPDVNKMASPLFDATDKELFAMVGNDIVNVHHHYLVLVICEVDENAMLAKWRFSHNGTLYGDYIPFRINTKDKLQQIKQAVNALIDQQDTVRKELNNGCM